MTYNVFSGTLNPTHSLDLDSVKKNQRAKCPGKRLFSAKVLVQTHRQTHTHQTDCANWTTKVVGKTFVVLHVFAYDLCDATE